MSNTVTGQVGLVYEKKVGRNTLYSIKLENDDNWYRTGKVKPDGIDKDDFVEFEYEEKKGQKVVDLDTLKKVDPPRVSGSSASSGSGDNGGVVGTAGITLKDLRISIGYAREQAIKVTEMLLEHGALELPPKTKVADRHTAILGFITNLSREYFAEGVAINEDDYERALDYVSTTSGDDVLDLYGDGGDGAEGSDD